MAWSLHPNTRTSSEICRNTSRVLKKQLLNTASSCLLLLRGSLSFSFFGLSFSTQLPETPHLLFKVLMLVSADDKKPPRTIMNANIHQGRVFSEHNLPEEPHISKFLGQGIVYLVLRVPFIHFFPLCQRRLFEQLHHLHGFGVCRPYHVTKDAGTEASHAHGIAGQIRHDCLKERCAVLVYMLTIRGVSSLSVKTKCKKHPS